MKKRTLALALAVVTALWSFTAADIQLGRQTFNLRPARAIGADVSFRSAPRAMGSMRFLARVGGVAFAAVAAPQGAPPRTISLSYRRDVRDGQRVQVFLDGVPYDLQLADWIAVPTARWANQDKVELITAFGDLRESVTAAERACMYVFNYASQLDGTLIGLRLMQADLIAMSDDFGDLFKDDGRYVLGNGESAPTPDEVRERQRLRERVFDELEGKFQSYVFTDAHADIRFEGRDGHLELTGGPTYRVWTTAARLLDAAGERALIDQKRALSAPAMKRQAATLRATLTKRLADMSMTPADRAETKRGLDRLVAVIRSRATVEERASALAALQYAALAMEPHFLDDAENPLADPETISSLNPDVYRAVRSFSQAAAFFRYVRTKYPKQWTAFLRQLPSTATLTPQVRLPTVLPKPCAADYGDAPDLGGLGDDIDDPDDAN